MDNYLEELSNICGLPFNETLKDVKIIQLGFRILFISNYKKIINYASNSIDLKVKGEILKIAGNDLKIKQMNSNEMIVLGNIYSLSLGDYEKK